MAKNILLVLLEFDNWEQGRSWSYTGSYAFKDGFERNGHRCFLLPAIHGRAPDAVDSFIKHAPALFAGQQFDEAWIWGNHASYDDNFWSWLKEVAPIRVGVALESLNHTPLELEALPFLQKRQDDVFVCLRHCTHAVAIDEVDVEQIEDRFGIPATPNVFMVPEQFVRNDPAPDHDVASFIGAGYFTGPAYNYPKAPLLPRNQFLADSRLHGLMNRPHFQLPERGSRTLERFEEMQQEMTARLRAGKLDPVSFNAYVEELPRLRGDIFAMLLDGFRLGMASVNLPTLAKSYSGRVVEAMAACVPSLSWRPPERPQCARWFKEDDELVLFDSVEQLADKIIRLRQDAGWRASLVTNGRKAVLERYTSQIRCRQYSDWIEHGTPLSLS
ncbi:MAG TPA: glycosyltransferase [Rhodocyclaceae bacterium]|nr:glycosyltransferase [Rhodocyclaceae bacterium]